MLKHTFLRGVHDLNVIAAIIIPRADPSVLKKCTSAGTFMFGIEERGLLWEQDLAFPGWAWVYKDKSRGFSSFLQRLKQATKTDGYDVEFVMLYGPDCGSPDDVPTGAYGCETVIMTDAARQASFQRSNGRLRDFDNCTRWRRVPVDKGLLERYAKAKAHQAMLRMQTACPDEAQSMLDDGRFYGFHGRRLLTQILPGHAFVERTTLATVARATRDLEHVLYCRHQSASQSITIRFVKSKSAARQYQWIRKISSTSVRRTMRKQAGRRLKGALKEIALSGDVLWRHQSIWIDEAKKGVSRCVSFPRMLDEDLEVEGDDRASIDCEDGSSTRSDVLDNLYLEEHENRFSEVSTKKENVVKGIGPGEASATKVQELDETGDTTVEGKSNYILDEQWSLAQAKAHTLSMAEGGHDISQEPKNP